MWDALLYVQVTDRRAERANIHLYRDRLASHSSNRLNVSETFEVGDGYSFRVQLSHRLRGGAEDEPHKSCFRPSVIVTSRATLTYHNNMKSGHCKPNTAVL